MILNQVDHAHTGTLGQSQALAVVGGDGAVAGKGKAERLGEAVHGVGGEHAGAGTAARAAVLGQFLLLLRRHLTGMDLADGLDAGGVVGDIALIISGGHGAAGNDDGGNVHTGGGHDGAGHGLVAGDHQNQAVQTVGHGHALDGVGNQFTAGQRIHHSLVRHGDAVADGDGGELHRDAAGHQDALLGRIRDAAQMEVSGDDLVEGVDDTDQGLAADVLLEMAGGIEQAAGIGVFDTGEDLFRIQRHCIESFLLEWFDDRKAGGGLKPPPVKTFRKIYLTASFAVATISATESP